MAPKSLSETERRLHYMTMADMFVSLGLAGLVGGLTFQRAPGWWAIVLIGIALVVCVPLGVPRKAANWMRRQRPGSHAFWVVTTPIVMAAALGLYTYMTLFEVRLGHRLEWTQMLLSGSLALCVLWNAGLAVYNFFSLLRARRIA